MALINCDGNILWHSLIAMEIFNSALPFQRTLQFEIKLELNLKDIGR